MLEQNSLAGASARAFSQKSQGAICSGASAANQATPHITLKGAVSNLAYAIERMDQAIPILTHGLDEFLLPGDPQGAQVAKDALRTNPGSAIAHAINEAANRIHSQANQLEILNQRIDR